MPVEPMNFIIAIMLGTLLAIVYSLRVLFVLERRVANMESHIEKLVKNVLYKEKSIETALSRRR